MHKAVFLDRDGVINDGTLYYTYKIADFHFNPGIFESLKLLQKNHYKLIIVTNQGGVAKDLYSIKDVENVHEYMLSCFLKEGINIDGIYYCPHHSDISQCNCRKPQPGMLLDAIKDFNLSPSKSFLIGDSQRDIVAAESAGVKGVLINKNENIFPICKSICTP